MRSILSNGSGFPSSDVGADNVQVIVGRFERLFSVVMGYEAGVVIKRCISFPSETIEDGQQTNMFLIDARPNKFDNRDVVSWLTPGAIAIAEHETERGFEHRFVGLLKASFLIESKDLMSGDELLVCACQEARDLRPVNSVGLKLLHAAPTSGTRLLCETLSRKESLRPRRDFSSFLVRTV